MNGLEFLKTQPESVKKKIIEKYESLEKFYGLVFLIYEAEHKWVSVKTADGKIKMQKIENKLNELEAELESFGADDGHWILTEISSDHGEMIVRKNIQNLDKYLNQFGLDFETTRKYMKEKHDI
jgi:hypothetical protein